MTGTYQVTSDGQAGPAKAVRVWSVVVKSDTTAAVVLLKNGTSTSGTEYASIDGTVSKSVIANYEGGMVFPAGCYVDLDSHSTYVTVNLEVIG